MTLGLADGWRNFRQLFLLPEKFLFCTATFATIECPNLVPQRYTLDRFDISHSH